jgi:F-type H+-transporting ATPase subunit gamma
VLRIALNSLKEWEGKGVTDIRVTAIGNEGPRLHAAPRRQGRVQRHAPRRHAAPGQDDRPGEGHARCLPGRRARRRVHRLHPLPQHHEAGAGAGTAAAALRRTAAPTEHGWDYIYEPDARAVIDELLVRYVEALVYQSVAENMASEQSARMVAMKAASDNAGNVINELQLVYNKTRQAAITKEISEIVGGAAGVTHLLFGEIR